MFGLRKKKKVDYGEIIKEACKKEFESVLNESRNKERARVLKSCENLIYTIKQIRKSTDVFSMKVQGKHPETGGTTVIYFDANKYKTLGNAKFILQRILFGQQNDEVEDFIKRAKSKVVKGYANQICINGRDNEGDSLEYELKFKTQEHLFEFLKTGIFDMENPDHTKYLVVDLWEA